MESDLTNVVTPVKITYKHNQQLKLLSLWVQKKRQSTAVQKPYLTSFPNFPRDMTNTYWA